MKKFCISGPVRCEDHYCVPGRLNEKKVRELINDKEYFVLHAPRQTGKTSTMLNFTRQLNKEGKYIALYVNVEGGLALRGDIDKSLPVIIQQFSTRVKEQLDETTGFFDAFESLKKENVSAGSLLATLLSRWSAQSVKPIALFLDEIDSLVGDTLISVLRQLRSGYDQRPKNFPQSVCLIGVRDVRDYMIWSDKEQKSILGGSAFNIKSDSLVLPDFTPEQTKELLLQHVHETGQKFTDEAIEYVFEQTQGQPWLTNALAYQACFRDVTDRSITITKEILERAREALIARRDTHIDVLINRLSEPRVCRIVQAILEGQDAPQDFPIDDILYMADLGLIKRFSSRLEIANPIYEEILPRELSYGTQRSITQETSWYQKPNKQLDIEKLLTSFQQFFRENIDAWIEKFQYKEVGPHLLLMAFLQRVVNGGGKIHKEYGLGRKRVDLLLTWHEKLPTEQRIVIELKIYKGPKAIEEGLEQTAQYMDTSNVTEGHLVIFDRRPERTWDEKIYHRVEACNNKTIYVWGM